MTKVLVLHTKDLVKLSQQVSAGDQVTPTIKVGKQKVRLTRKARGLLGLVAVSNITVNANPPTA